MAPLYVFAGGAMLMRHGSGPGRARRGRPRSAGAIAMPGRHGSGPGGPARAVRQGPPRRPGDLPRQAVASGNTALGTLDGDLPRGDGQQEQRAVVADVPRDRRGDAVALEGPAEDDADGQDDRELQDGRAGRLTERDAADVEDVDEREEDRAAHERPPPPAAPRPPRRGPRAMPRSAS